MYWNQAWDLMKNGYDVKLPSWGGFWRFNQETQVIEMHTKDCQIIDIRDTERVLYTFDNIASDKWIITNDENTPIKGGTAHFDFSEAIRYIQRKIPVVCDDTMDSSMYVVKGDTDRIYLHVGDEVLIWAPVSKELISVKWRFA